MGRDRDFNHAYLMLNHSLRSSAWAQNPSTYRTAPDLPFSDSDDSSSASSDNDGDGGRTPTTHLATSLLPPTPPPAQSHVSHYSYARKPASPHRHQDAATPVQIATLPTPDTTPDSYATHTRAASNGRSRSPGGDSFRTAREHPSADGLAHEAHTVDGAQLWLNSTRPARLRDLGWGQDARDYTVRDPTTPRAEILRSPMWIDRNGLSGPFGRNQQGQEDAVPRKITLRHKKQKLDKNIIPSVRGVSQHEDGEVFEDSGTGDERSQQGIPLLQTPRHAVDGTDRSIGKASHSSNRHKKNESVESTASTSTAVSALLVDSTPPQRKHTLRHVSKTGSLREARPETPVTATRNDATARRHVSAPVKATPTRDAKLADGHSSNVKDFADLSKAAPSYRQREATRLSDKRDRAAESQIIAEPRTPEKEHNAIESFLEDGTPETSLLDDHITPTHHRTDNSARSLVTSKYYHDPDTTDNKPTRPHSRAPADTVAGLQTQDLGLGPKAVSFEGVPSETSTPKLVHIAPRHRHHNSAASKSDLERRIARGVHYVSPEEAESHAGIHRRHDSVPSTVASDPRKSTDTASVHWKREGGLSPGHTLHFRGSLVSSPSEKAEIGEARSMAIFPHNNDSIIVVHREPDSQPFSSSFTLRESGQTTERGEPLFIIEQAAQPLQERIPDTIRGDPRPRTPEQPSSTNKTPPASYARHDDRTPLIDIARPDLEGPAPSRRPSLLERARRVSSELLEPFRQVSRKVKTNPPSAWDNHRRSKTPEVMLNEPRASARDSKAVAGSSNGGNISRAHTSDLSEETTTLSCLPPLKSSTGQLSNSSSIAPSPMFGRRSNTFNVRERLNLKRSASVGRHGAEAPRPGAAFANISQWGKDHVPTFVRRDRTASLRPRPKSGDALALFTKIFDHRKPQQSRANSLPLEIMSPHASHVGAGQPFDRRPLVPATTDSEHYHQNAQLYNDVFDEDDEGASTPSTLIDLTQLDRRERHSLVEPDPSAAFARTQSPPTALSLLADDQAGTRKMDTVGAYSSQDRPTMDTAQNMNSTSVLLSPSTGVISHATHSRDASKDHDSLDSTGVSMLTQSTPGAGDAGPEVRGFHPEDERKSRTRSPMIFGSVPARSGSVRNSVRSNYTGTSNHRRSASAEQHPEPMRNGLGLSMYNSSGEALSLVSDAVKHPQPLSSHSVSSKRGTWRGAQRHTQSNGTHGSIAHTDEGDYREGGGSMVDETSDDRWANVISQHGLRRTMSARERESWERGGDSGRGGGRDDGLTKFERDAWQRSRQDFLKDLQGMRKSRGNGGDTAGLVVGLAFEH